jgi:non-ribosomal peptide synthetase-like protein
VNLLYVLIGVSTFVCDLDNGVMMTGTAMNNAMKNGPAVVEGRRPDDRFVFGEDGVLLNESYDNAIRWVPGERLDHVFERRCDSLPAEHLAVITETEEVTFAGLDERANQLARHLLEQGVTSGDRVGLLFDKSLHAYVSMLAVMKVNAAYVPFDAAFPPERISYIAEDARVSCMLSLSAYEEQLAGLVEHIILLDRDAKAIDARSTARLTDEERVAPVDELSYIIYTSGSTGRPKGVAIDHGSICNFVCVAAEVYGIRPDDRMFQGLTLAFDFSVEEIWVPLMAGAALIPAQSDTNLVGKDLADFITQRGVTALCCVPTLLATLDEELPDLRFLLVSGEACPQEIVRRWYRTDRILINAYGPTEATVTATLTELYPGKPVTIGGPLPTYSIVILAEDEPRLLDKGEVGEVCIGGIGLAVGYVNRQDLTDKAFIPDFIGLPDNPSKRIYRTGDLGRINDDNEIEYLGRIDTQVKVRGYRIELTEIESVFMEIPEIAQAVVSTHKPESGGVELAAFYTLREDVDELPLEQLVETLREQLPSYMVPSYIDKLEHIPMLPSQKADRKKLPAPSQRINLRQEGEYVEPEGPLECAMAGALSEVMGMEGISATEHFFAELGVHSLLMAKFVTKMAEVRPDLALSMRDLYQHPSIRELSDHLQQQTTALTTTEQPPKEAFHQATTWEYLLCGALQGAFMFGVGVAFLALGIAIFDWVIVGATATEIGLRSFASAFGLMAIFLFVPIFAKQLLIGEWKPGKIKVWSLDYFRFWVVKSITGWSPMMLFTGTPIYNAYLRLLGADVGRDVVNFSRFMPVCTDLITIGDGAVFQKDSVFQGYKAENGYIHIGPVTVGRNAYVGEGSVLSIHSVMEDDTQLGHSSSLQSHQVVPAGKAYHGSPAVETTTEYKRVAPMRCSALRKFLYCSIQIGGLLVLPAVGFALLAWLLPQYIGTGQSLFSLTAELSAFRSLFALDVLFGSLVLFVALIAFSFVYVMLFPRFLNWFLKPDKEYVLYGVHYLVFRWVQALTNNNFFKVLFGDSSLKPYYYQWLGLDQGQFKQSGSNFGLAERFDNPYMCKIGEGTMVSDGLSMINADYSSSSFKVSPVHIGEGCFIGNDLRYPAGATTGDNCLFATKAMIPIDGPTRENVGLLGSPCFEIPRETFAEQEYTEEELDALRIKQLPAKLKSNLTTLFTFLLARWFVFTGGFLLVYASLLAYASVGLLGLVAGGLVSAGFVMGFFILIERYSLRFRPLEPHSCTIYDPHFWKVEHFWKHCENGLITMFAGTPYKNVMSRFLGMKVGKRVFDDGLQASERSLVSIGDDTMVNSGVFMQAHSLEDGFFKSDRIVVGERCTVGVKAYVHYGSTMSDDSILEPDAFLMKGQTMAPKSVWVGNPAQPNTRLMNTALPSGDA